MRIRTSKGFEEARAVDLIGESEYRLRLIDQRLLPHQLKFIETSSMNEAITWIKDMAVRGAPAIGATGAFALVIGLQEMGEPSPKELEERSKQIIEARPTAKDLHTFVAQLLTFALELPELDTKSLARRARHLAEASRKECELIGERGKDLIKERMGVLTHCNAGALATVDFGTALSPIRFAHYEGRRFKVFVDETRPRLQGMLTAWELLQEGIEHEIIVDNAAGFYMQQGKIQLVITGTDRVLRDGSVANKIGTLEKAILAKYFGIPVYIAMPWTTFDPHLTDPSQIPIEYRSTTEVTNIVSGDTKVEISPQGSSASNPAFDVTPAELITGYITKDGVLTSSQLLELYENYLKD